MVTIVRTKSGMPVSDIFFASGEPVADPHSSLSLFVQARSPLPGFRPFKTHLVDLSEKPANLFSRISQNCRYKIKRAEREGCIPAMTTAPSSVDLDSFGDYFDGFAQLKSLPPANRPKLAALASGGSLLVSSVSAADGQVLAMHAYVRDPLIRRARLLYSASHFRGTEDTAARNLIGRANRLLHWYEIESLHDQRYLQYDLGGIPIDDSDPAKNAIARFKREFNGSEVTEYNGYRANSLLGRLAIAYLQRAA